PLRLAEERSHVTPVGGVEVERAECPQCDHRSIDDEGTRTTSGGHAPNHGWVTPVRDAAAVLLRPNLPRRHAVARTTRPDWQLPHDYLNQSEVTMRGTRTPRAGLALTLFLAVTACSSTADSRLPTPPRAVQTAASSGVAWGPETPNFNLEVILRGQGFGHVKFRQPNDAEKVVYLETWVRGLAPNHSYLLQRAVDKTIDDNCTSTAW